MIPVQSLLNSLQAWAQEELAGQRRIQALIERQERALCANDTQGLDEATRALEPTCIFEIGTFRGRTAMNFALNSPETCRVFTLDLPPGPHTLQLLLGDLNHIPHEPPVMSEKITVNVQ